MRKWLQKRGVKEEHYVQYTKKYTNKIIKFCVARTGYVGWVSIVDIRKLSFESMMKWLEPGGTGNKEILQETRRDGQDKGMISALALWMERCIDPELILQQIRK